MLPLGQALLSRRGRAATLLLHGLNHHIPSLGPQLLVILKQVEPLLLMLGPDLV